MTGQSVPLDGQAAVQDPKPAGLIRQPQEEARQEALQELQSVEYYSQIQVLGQGTFGLVAKAVDSRPSTPVVVAIKLLRRGSFIQHFQTYVKREILHQSSLKHPFIIGLREVTLLKRHLAIVMEYAQGGDLYKYVLRQRPTRLQESHARWIFQQLIIGVDYCHSMGVANRDLKLENLLLDRDGTNGRRPLLKICDFGYSKHELNSPATTGVGTPIYMAPEIVYGSRHYDAKQADIWSIGIILYTILFGRYPFNANDPDHQRQFTNAHYVLPQDVTVSAPCREMLEALLVGNPSGRITMERIKVHPWFLTQLPDGALAMNEYYMRSAPKANAISAQVSQIVDCAVQAAQPGEEALSVRL